MKIIIITGLPGSGKTSLAQTLCGENDYLLDDLSVLLREAHLPLAQMQELILRNHSHVLEIEKTIQTLFITDVATCIAQSQHVLHNILIELFPHSQQEWIFFLPNIEQSFINHQKREQRGKEQSRNVTSSIYNMAKLFSIHPDIEHLSHIRLTFGAQDTSDVSDISLESHNQYKTGLKRDIK